MRIVAKFKAVNALKTKKADDGGLAASPATPKEPKKLNRGTSDRLLAPSKGASHGDRNSTICEKHGDSHGDSHEDRMESSSDGPAKTLSAEAEAAETAEPGSRAAQQWCAPTPIGE
jgi:hypothetical protein